VPKGGKLTERQRDFAHLVVKHKLNATKAAEEAGYSKRSAGNQGARMMKNDDIARLVAKLQASQLEKVDASAEGIKRELALMAHSDVGELHDARGKVLPLRKMPELARRAISGIDYENGRIVKIRLWDKNRAAEALAKHHGLLHEVLEVVEAQAVSEVLDSEWEALSLLRHVVRAKE
jgi:phage terminase small subunit